MMKRHLFTSVCVMLLIVGTAKAGEIDPAFEKMAMFGISRTSGEMKRFDFPDFKLNLIGTVKDKNGAVMTGINASGYIPGHSNIMGFWKDNSGKSRLVYIRCDTALATPVGGDLGIGDVTGAVAGLNGNASVAGLVNINPNNSPSFEFQMMMVGKSVTILREDLHENATLKEDGTMVSGPASYVRFKPKGNGNQNGVIIDGQAMQLDNGKLYTIVGDIDVRLFNDSFNNGKAMGKWWLNITTGKCYVLEDGKIIAGGTTGKTPWALYAVQNSQVSATPADDSIDFVIDDDTIVPSEDYALRVKVIGAAISNGYYNYGVTTKMNIGGTTHQPFGSFTGGKTGNVNDDQNPRSYTFESKFSAGTKVDVIGRSWKKKRNKNGKKDRHWYQYLEASGLDTGTQQIKVLRDGDPVPDISGYNNQSSIEDFVKDYINTDSNTMKLGKNEAIYLFELGTTNMGSSAADFQDLVVLVSLAKEPGDFDTPPSADELEPLVTSKSRLLKVNHTTAGYSQLMSLKNEYDGLATENGLVFFATKGSELYKLDVVSQTETLVGSTASSKVYGLECAGATLMGYEMTGNKLMPIDMLSGASLGSHASLGMANIGTIIFMPIDKDPTVKPISYD